MAQQSRYSEKGIKTCRHVIMRGFVEDVRTNNTVPKRQIKKVALEFAAIAQDEQYRETFENIRQLRDRFEPEDCSESQAA